MMRHDNNLLVIGAPGNVGTCVVEQALDAGFQVKVGAYEVDLARQVFRDRVDICFFDFTDPVTCDDTFQGVKDVFFIRPPQISETKRDMVPALEKIESMGVEHMMFLSLLGINRRMPHFEIEKFLKESSMRYTLLRSGFFMQNFTTQFREDIRNRNEIYVPAGKGKMSIIDTRDIASVAVQAFSNETDENRVFELTGSESLNYYDIANTLSRVLGRQIVYPKPSPKEFREKRISQGWDPELVDVLNMLFRMVRLRLAGKTTNDFEEFMRKKPISFEQFVIDHQNAWKT